MLFILEQEVLAPLFERKVQSGAFCDVGEGTFTLEDKPVEKGGPSTEDDAYKGCNLRIVSGMAQGHFARVTGYVGETRVCTLLEWYAALPDLSSRFEILGEESQISLLHFGLFQVGCMRGYSRMPATYARRGTVAAALHHPVVQTHQTLNPGQFERH